jgi:hypothetical protein
MAGKRLSKVNERGRKKDTDPTIDRPHGNVKVHGNFKEINWKEVERRIEVGSSGLTIAKCLRIDPDTFYKRFEEQYGVRFKDYTNGLSDCLPANILLRQYIKAMEGNVEMLKLLGRENCGQGRDEDPASRKLAEKFDETILHLSNLFSGVKTPDISRKDASDLKIDESKMSKETKS